MMVSVTTQISRHTVAILGSGITGLSTAYYINRKFGPAIRPVIFESTDRVGGWVKSIKHENNVYEVGPRTIRPAGVSGLNTLDLIQEIGLDQYVNYVPSDHPAASTRLIYLDGELVNLPVGIEAVFKKIHPFREALFKTFFKEVFRAKKIAPDDTIHNFVFRRFSPQIADIMVDPIIRGICAGDARNISVKFFARQLYDWEQRRGSVALGAILDKIFRYSGPPNPDSSIPGYSSIGNTNLSRASKADSWSVWTLENGLETLPTTLEKKIIEGGGEILKNSPVTSIIFDEEGEGPNQKHQIEYLDPKTNKPSQIECSHIISAVPALTLSSILSRSSPQPINPTIIELLNSIPAVNVTVTNFKFQDPLAKPAFGFLVPSSQKDLDGLLGVVFNTCVFPQNDDNILTSMSRGISLDTINKYLLKVLHYENPTFVDSSELVNCIPQYTLGHYERLDKLRNAIKREHLPLTLAGASYDGVSVNDCIFSGRRSSERLPFKDLDDK